MLARRPRDVGWDRDLEHAVLEELDGCSVVDAVFDAFSPSHRQREDIDGGQSNEVVAGNRQV